LIPSVWPTTTEYVLLEALGLSKPLVAFNVGIHQEILRHGHNAMVADAVNVSQFSQYIEILDRDPDLRRRLSLEARRLYEQITDPEAYRHSLLASL
jgi:glycosyltransferase involved in cell wall biosynthesis